MNLLEDGGSSKFLANAEKKDLCCALLIGIFMLFWKPVLYECLPEDRLQSHKSFTSSNLSELSTFHLRRFQPS